MPHAPDAVAFAHSTDEVSAIVKLCAEYKTPVIAFGAGTSLEGHVAALAGGISIDMSADEPYLARQRAKISMPLSKPASRASSSTSICAIPAFSFRLTPAPTPRSAGWPRRAPREPMRSDTERCARMSWR